MASQTTHGATGPPKATTDSVLEAGAAATQSFAPIKAICAHLNAFLMYDAPTNPARLIGVEYMITPRLYETLDKEERKLWHSHDFEVGILTSTSPFRTFSRSRGLPDFKRNLN
jgi:hypothetical protein